MNSKRFFRANKKKGLNGTNFINSFATIRTFHLNTSSIKQQCAEYVKCNSWKYKLNIFQQQRITIIISQNFRISRNSAYSLLSVTQTISETTPTFSTEWDRIYILYYYPDTENPHHISIDPFTAAKEVRDHCFLIPNFPSVWGSLFNTQLINTSSSTHIACLQLITLSYICIL